MRPEDAVMVVQENDDGDDEGENDDSFAKRQPKDRRKHVHGARRRERTREVLCLDIKGDPEEITKSIIAQPLRIAGSEPRVS